MSKQQMICHWCDQEIVATNANEIAKAIKAGVPKDEQPKPRYRYCYIYPVKGENNRTGKKACSKCEATALQEQLDAGLIAHTNRASA